LIEGVRMDLTKKEYYTNEELDLYCYRVASTIGLMMVHIMMENPEGHVIARAKDLGLAMQLTNILRDIKEDYLKGRIYLPYETREQYGITETELQGSQITQNFRKMLQYEIERAKGLYRVAEFGIYDLPKESQFTILIASRVYGDILNQIKRNNYNVLSTRAVVSKPRKLYIFIKTKIEFNKKKFMKFIDRNRS
jgi:phytoene synthase